MNKSLVHRLIDKRYGRVQKFGALVLVARRHCGPEFLDLRAKLAPVAPVNFISLRVLTNAFFC